MIVIDTSSLVAIITGEPEHDRFNRVIAGADECCISAASYVETFIVVESRLGTEGIRELSLYLHEAGIRTVPVDKDQADLARHAYSKYGKGRHAASLNYGDCFTYALARQLGAPVLFKGDDFTRTDLHPA